MPNRLLKKIQKAEKGITGLETAIILIAFVVVASVFAYTALSAGLFATQKSQEAVYSGLKEAQSTLELRGGIIATANTTGANGKIARLSFTVSSVLGGEPIDFSGMSSNSSNTGTAASGATNTVVISYVDSDQRVEDLYWTITKLGSADADDLLETNEKFQVTIGSSLAGTSGGNLVDALSVSDLAANERFTIEVKPQVGAVLIMERSTPAWIDTIMDLR